MFFDSQATDWAQKEQIARTICQQVGFEFHSVLEASVPGVATMGQPTAQGPARGRIVVFGKGGRV
jgi:hypothetical protein